ncbi:MAG TPA: hypothetical protein VHW01_10975, partial [Polyangiaceae bacterium]|nr:hypothetical protein [Polyangiaceae bacterium]
PVPDSFATARFNANDEVTTEWVYWPPISRSTVDDAHAIQKQLSDPAGRQTFMAHLPPSLQTRPGEITIRHSDFDDDSGFVAFASYDVHYDRGDEGAGRAGTRHFLINGTEVSHPNRRRSNVPDTPRDAN